ncbi:MAG: hypothetical protein HOP15_02175, partial [Planctomycetes bacterium]|nr:hypothetical protein [Planctomycetota bacterium]
TDSVTCVFTTGCRGGGDQISDNPAFLPVDGDWILDGPPVVEDFFPEGTRIAGTTPVVLVFSESIQEETIDGALEIVPLLGGGQPGQPVSGVRALLVSDGRVLLLLPPPQTPLLVSDYLVRLSEQALVLDLTGQELDVDPGASLGTFTVEDSAPAVPGLVMTFPGDGATNQSETTQLVVVFDRPVLASTVTAAAFDVRVAGANPANDPPAAPVASNETRVFLYRSVNASGRPVPLGTDVEVELRLSPASAPISEQGGDELAPETITFQTLPFEPPLRASLLSDPSDAIGLRNLTNGDAEELEVEVELDGLRPNDSIDLFLFGAKKSTEANPPLIALQALSLRLSGTAPILSVIFKREDIPLQVSSAPDDVNFNDGPVTFAFRARRGTVEAPVRVLDLDPDPDTILDPVLDTSVPKVLSLLGSTGTSAFRGEMRGLSLAGLVAVSERLRSVEVSTPLGNNPPLAPVVGSGAGAGGAFLAAPVPIGIVAGGSTTYSFVARDAAHNAAPALTGASTQLGVVGPAPIVLGQPIEVEVFDSRTLAALDGALVLVHSDEGVAFPFVQSGTTGLDGKVSVPTAGAPSAGAIVTVVLAGYDLFTLRGAPSARLSIPLGRSRVARAAAAGVLRTSDVGASASLPDLDRRFDDSRRRVELPRGFVSQVCTGQGTLACPYGPESIQDQRLGARSFFAGRFRQDNDVAFSEVLLLQAFAFSVPLAPVLSGAVQTADLEVSALLTSSPTDAVQKLPEFTFQVDAASGVGLPLEDDPATTGVPFATVEVLVPGLPGSIAVAQALSYGPDGGPWKILGALPGAITAGGSLGLDGIVDTDPFVRVDLVDQVGNSAGVRPRLSSIAPGNPVFRALNPPTQLAPASGAQSGGQAFTLLLTHVIGDARGENGKGMYRVELVDTSGRGWTLWRFDPSGAVAVPIRVVDVGDAGAAGLADGNLRTFASAFAWGSLSPTAFLWSDVEREFELFARAAEFTFTKP